MKKIIKYIIIAPVSIMRKFEYVYEIVLSNIFGSNFSSQIRTKYINNNNQRFQVVEHKNKASEIFKASFFTPNYICQMRADTFSTKEPEMLEWIDEYGDNGIFFDIGANIGLYSIYFAKTKKGMTYAFEPSVFNIGQIAKNISINKLSDKVNLIPNPLSNTNTFSKFINSNTNEGGAHNAFGVNYGSDGNLIRNNIEFSILGLSIDFMFETGILKDFPTMIKIDVDGIEHLILEGAKKTIKRNECKTIFIEVNDAFELSSNKISQILTNCGFLFKEKRQNEAMGKSTYNQIWIKG